MTTRSPQVLIVGAITLYFIAEELWDRGILQWILGGLFIFGSCYLIFEFVRNIRKSNSTLAMSTHSDLIAEEQMQSSTQSKSKNSRSYKRLNAATVETAIANIAPEILSRSGSVFYTGRSAFTAPCSVYLLGLNPGGDPISKRHETIAADIEQHHTQSASWSAYLDESWEGRPCGTQGMQPRVLHLIKRLGMQPHQVPASNVVFVRSRTEAALQDEKVELLRACLPVHRAVIATTKPRVIVCFGGTAGRWMRDFLDANRLIDQYRETNNRGWRSECHMASNGRIVATLSHPSRANWCNPDSDPSELVIRALSRS